MTKFLDAFYFALLLVCAFSYGQQKTLYTIKTTENITIDGQLSESVWSNAPVASDFIMFSPDNGKKIPSEKRTDVKVVYDDDAIYVGAIMYDDEPQKILKEINERDNFGTADHFGIFINGYNDGQQEFRFFVSAAGVQLDCVATDYSEGTSEDYSWNAIWNSSVKLTDFGWVVEFKIPYAALRFSNEDKQTWGINFYREVRRTRESYSWNFLDANILSELQQAGVLKGIEDIKTPTRLFLIPYASYYYDYSDGEAQNKLKAGLDIKYGINDAFTLDAILVPDFGQTKFDNVVLNLTPFEQQFNENRPFFTEGTDIFQKGSLLYSRRIGGSPSISPNLEADEYIEELPNTVDLLNAVKISGRTKSGLGIGFLNAVTKRTYARVRNSVTLDSRDVIIEPLVNYNLIVLDQRINNSSISLANSNVSRDGSYRDANVTALAYDLNTKNNGYKLTGDFKYSYINDTQDLDGFKTAINLVKTSGTNRFEIFGNYLSANFDTNDLGILFMNNYYSFYGNYNYRILNPKGIYNAFRFDASTALEFENITGKLQEAYSLLTVTATTRKNDFYQVNFQVEPLTTFDFYEPLTERRFSYIPKGFIFNFLYSSNYNRTLALDIKPAINIRDDDRSKYSIRVSPRYRISDKILLIYATEFSRSFHDRGYASGRNTTEIKFGDRDLQTLTSEISGRYSINNQMTVNLSGRYYWSFSRNTALYTLNNNGSMSFLTKERDLTSIYDRNLNLWNFDLSYSWWFAPASQISVLYRNNAYDYRQDISPNIGRNVDNLFNNNINSVFSISIRYFIDYNSLRK